MVQQARQTNAGRVIVDVHVFPLVAVLLNSLAFSSAAKPAFVRQPACELTQAIRRTVLDEHLFIVDDTDVLPRQVVDLAVLHFPQFVGHL